MATISRIALGLLFFSLFGLIPHATPKQTSPKKPKAPCDWAMTQMEMNQCSAEEYRKADAHLNAVYRRAILFMENDIRDAVTKGDDDEKKHAETAIQKLKATEKVWIQYRDLDCDAARFENEGGSIAPLTWAVCMTQVTEQRIIDLKNAYESPDRIIE
jgi:uncharacterized protein YecT (DUF1311 family)